MGFVGLVFKTHSGVHVCVSSACGRIAHSWLWWMRWMSWRTWFSRHTWYSRLSIITYRAPLSLYWAKQRWREIREIQWPCTPVPEQMANLHLQSNILWILHHNPLSFHVKHLHELSIEMFACDIQAFLCFHGILGLLQFQEVPVMKS